MEKDSKRVTIVLEKAGLETIKTKRGYELMSAEEHKNMLLKHKRDPSVYRPDIVHQLLLSLLDSPLNKAEQLQVYIRTINNVLIEVNPQIRIPRTYKRFAGLMVQLLHKLSIRAVGTSQKLLKVVKNPIEGHLPLGSTKIGCTTDGELVNMKEFATELKDDEHIVFMIGSHAHGDCKVDWTERNIAVSQYALSAAACATRVLSAYEEHLGIL